MYPVPMMRHTWYIFRTIIENSQYVSAKAAFGIVLILMLCTDQFEPLSLVISHCSCLHLI